MKRVLFVFLVLGLALGPSVVPARATQDGVVEAGSTDAGPGPLQSFPPGVSNAERERLAAAEAWDLAFNSRDLDAVPALPADAPVMVSATAAFAQDKTIQRPIEDFVSAQGTFCIDGAGGDCFLFIPPVANFLGWDTLQEAPPQRGNVQPARCASVDYAGLSNAKIEELSGGAISFGTTTSGTITERPLADGRAEISVRLHTNNALTWVAGGDDNTCDFAAGALLFGHRVVDVLRGKDAALGDSFLEVVFINLAPGSLLPDLIQLILDPVTGQELRSVSFFASASGTLRAAFDVPEGTPGRAQVAQTGILFKTRFEGATADGFPAKRINLLVQTTPR